MVDGGRSELESQVEPGLVWHGVVLETGSKKKEGISSIPGVLCSSTKETMNSLWEAVVVKLGYYT